MYKMIDVEQGSPEWFKARLGKWTASFFDKAITKTGKVSSQSEDVINRLVAELIVGEPDETFQSEAMLRGKEMEEEALDFLNFTYGYNFEPCGFMAAVDEDGRELGFGCSPDAIDEKNGIGLELKVPLLHTHLAYLCADVAPFKYTHQLQGGLMVSGFNKWVFCSYNPVVPSLVKEVPRDEKYIQVQREAISQLSKVVSERYEKLREIARVA